MLVRFLKTVLALFIALFCLFYATQNVFNLQSAHWFVSSVLLGSLCAGALRE